MKKIYISQEQRNMLLFENEGGNMKRARKYLESKGYNPQRRQEILDSIRRDIPNSRLQQCKFLLGVTRLYIEGELRDAVSIMNLNKTLKYIASDAHVNEYDFNLNGESLYDLVSRFRGVTQNDLQQSMNASNARQLTVNNNYDIVPIDSHGEAKKYADYTTWCVTNSERMYDTYTHNGSGRFYFCLRKGFENEPELKSEGCPLDNYGLSMIAVSVNEDGSVNTITCRWNHDNGGNDNIMNIEQLEEIIGRNFYQTFKPYTNEELMAKGIIPLGMIQQLLDSGKKPEEIFDECGGFKDGFAFVVLNGKWNFINGEGRLISSQWFDYCENFHDGFALVMLNDELNFINTKGQIVSSQWFANCYGFKEGFSIVGLNNKYNFINKEGKLLSNQWFDFCDDFHEGVAEVALNNKYNFINTEGKLLSNQWFDKCHGFSEGFAVVKLNSKWNFINKEGKLLSNQWFGFCYDFIEGFAVVKLNSKWNFINREGKLLSSQRFDYCGDFSDGFADVSLNSKWFKIGRDGRLYNEDGSPLSLSESKKNRKTIYITEAQGNKLKKAISAQDQVGGKVNAGIMDAVAGGAMCETTDVFGGDAYSRSESITFVTPTEGGSNKVYSSDEIGITHGRLLRRLTVEGVISYFPFNDKDCPGINPYMTGRYWVNSNTISLYRTPINGSDRNYTLSAIQQLGLDPNTIDVDFWDTNRALNVRSQFVLPFKWFMNGTLDDLLQMGVYLIVKRNYGLYQASLDNFKTYLFDREGKIVDNTLKEGNDNLIYQHGATPHKEIADFKPNIQPLIMYKQFKLRLDKNGNNLAPGYVFPLYVNTEAEGVSGKQSVGLEIGKWYKSGEGECWLDTKNNRLYTKGKGYGTDGNTIDKLAYRPGWHLTTTPWGNQRGDNKVVGGKPGTGNNYLNTRNSEVWAKVEICVDIDATERARAMSSTPADQCLQSLGDREYYKYKTNSNASDDQAWYIVDMIRIVDILDDDTVDSTNDEYYNNLLANNPGKKINSDPYNYTKELTNDIPYWKMPRTNGKRYSRADIEAMGYKPAEPTKINETDVDTQKYQIGFEKGGFEPYGHALNENVESRNKQYELCAKSMLDFFNRNGVLVKPYPKVILRDKPQEGILVKTGYYDPDNREVVIYTYNRSIKDCLRSMAHEFIHHSQNLKGMLKGYKGDTIKGDNVLEKLESEAYLKGNIYFRRWTEEQRPVIRNIENLNESIQDIYNMQDDWDMYGISSILSEFFNDKRNGITKKHWDLIPAQQYQNLLTRYMENPATSRIPDNVVYDWFEKTVRNAFNVLYITELAGHADGPFPAGEVQDEFDAWLGPGKYVIDDYCSGCDALDDVGFFEWCSLPDGSDGWSDFGIGPIFNELANYQPNMSAGDLLVLINRVLHIGHWRGDLASAFIEGGSQTCSNISGILRENIEPSQNLLSWFGKSVVVDENGKPKPMYHGTNAEFTAFSKDFFTHGGTAYLGIGFNFVSSDITARGYGKNVHEVYLKAEHPMTNTKKTLKFNDLVQAINAIDVDEDPDGSICTNILGMRIEKPTYRDIFNAAKSIYDYAESDGDIYSAVSLAYCGNNNKKIPSIFRSLFGFDSCVDYDKYSGRIQYAVVFEPNQIKSVNAMNFNPDSDEMIDEDFDMEEITNPDDIDLSSFDINNRLNPRFWKGGRIDSRVRTALLSIADDFVDTLDVSWAEPKDVIMTGSLANYNWSQKHSDVDLHILYDFKDVDENVSLVKEYFDSKRRLWNDEHQNITIAGFQVELYVQDIHEPHASTGVYSLDKDEWLVRPNIKNFDLDYDKDAVKEKVSEYMNKIDDLCDEYDDSVADCDLSELHDKAEKLFDDIKNERRNGFEHGGGEYNVGNLIFKSLRRNGYIGKLSKIRTDTYDDMKSIYNENNEAK